MIKPNINESILDRKVDDRVQVSVIIPAYNSSRYLTETLNSVFVQTYPVYEVIVVDDGSTDGTAEIVKPYTKLQSHKVTKSHVEDVGHRVTRSQVEVRYFRQGNAGPAAARNRGIKESKGEYIAFLDSDDLWLPDKIEKQVTLLEESGYAMVYCDMSHIEDGKFIYKSYLKEKGYKHFGNGNVYKGLLRENFIFTPTVLVKREIFDRVGYFDENYKICEDYKMWLKIAQKYEIGFLSEPLVIRRRIKINLTNDKFLFITSGIALFKELINENGSNRKIRKIMEGQLNKRFFELGYYYWDRESLFLARKNFVKALKFKKNILKIIPYILCSYFPRSAINTIRRLHVCLR